MRLVRFGEKGDERPGLWKDGRIIEIRKHLPDCPDIGRAFFEAGWIERVARINDPGEILETRLASPVSTPEKIICLGKNYADHAKEGGMSIPETPLLFSKTPNTVNGPFDPVILPESDTQIDWEVELAVVIGRTCKRVGEKDAPAFIAGYTVMNDVSARTVQFFDKQWFRGKSFDGFAPLGPVLVTPDELGDVSRLRLTTHVNGELMQDGATSDLIFDVYSLVSFISRDITLVPGDIISTGTPSGVGIFRDPPITLKNGDIVRCEISVIGFIENRFQAE
ncbi:MAG: fumarylacetoacetate hydrolase family protein [Deltaproteobacteria bacterium]|nr:fumarylacetoacetate hydrolase family protein [Deltaproteobacteria bacterium]